MVYISFPRGLSRRSPSQSSSASACKDKGKRRVREVEVVSDDTEWNTDDDEEL